ncbi:MAG: TonB-dependent receptor [Verrucomicrobia bacterium]|nr:TonB-dependent receptor [Verrucomicrobiota bacterium]
MRKPTLPRLNVIVYIASALLGTLLLAQTAPTAPKPPAGVDPSITELDVVIVTGRAGTDFRTKAQTSYAVTDISAEQLRIQAPMGVAEALKAIPGFWVESSGGEASNNIRARGIPADGFQTVQLQEDGLPIQHDGGLGWLNADQSYRMDETVQRLEIVRGGPSSVFASNAPGGIVNFVTRRGGDTPEGLLKYEFGDFNHHRVDVWHGGPAGAWRYGVGGFWRGSDGIRDPGFRANEGYQVRFALGHDLPKGGKIDANLKHFDDHAIFYLPVPLTFDNSGDPAGVPGFDPNYGTLLGPETMRVVTRTTAGPRDIDLKSGTHVKLTQLTARWQHQLPGEWRLENGFRHRISDTKREGFFPGSLTAGTTRLNQLRTGALAAYPTATNVQFRYTYNPGAGFDPANQNGNGLVHDGTAIRIAVDLDETINDLRLLRKLSIGNQTHDVGFGFYVASLDEKFRRTAATVFTEVRSNARLLDLVAVNAAGAAVGSMTENGISRHGSQFANGVGDSFTMAFYLSDEWQVTKQLRIDSGVRWERIEADGRAERSAAVNLGGPTPASANLLTGTGVYDPFDRRFKRIGWTVGADWQFTPRNGLFARVTPTFRLPSVGDFITNPANNPVIQRMDLYEAGCKYVSQPFDVFLTAFRTKFNNFPFGETLFNPATGGITQRTVYIQTDAKGLELEGNLRPARWFDLAATATFQKPEFGNFRVTQIVNNAPVALNFTGNRLLRVPELSFRVIPAFNLLGTRLRVQFPIEYYGDRFADAANSVKLPSYRVFNAAARFDVNRALTLHVNIDNFDNEIGLTEGNPRSGQFLSGDAGARFYLARPILGRSVRGAVTYRF